MINRKEDDTTRLTTDKIFALIAGILILFTIAFIFLSGTAFNGLNEFSTTFDVDVVHTILEILCVVSFVFLVVFFVFRFWEFKYGYIVSIVSLSLILVSLILLCYFSLLLVCDIVAFILIPSLLFISVVFSIISEALWLSRLKS